MKRKERCEILIHCKENFLDKWADKLENSAQMTLLEEPATGLVMVKMRESAQNSLFYLGEVFVSEAKVSCNGHIGIGIITGNQLQKAYDLAVIDAAYKAELPLLSEFEIELKKEAVRLQEERTQKHRKIMKTKVNFDTMDV
ncbi:phosphonate C-P lyase system protein PhnG [Amedibacillus sp. YH-ame10]